MRQITENMQMSAIDMAYAISSLLEAPSVMNMLSEQEIRKPGKGEKTEKNAYHETREQQEALDNLQSQLNDNFWTAYDAMDSFKGLPLLMKGIENAKQMQQAIVRVGTSIIERKEVKIAQSFRYVMLENDYLADVKLFQYPLALQKLGLFIMEAYQSEKKNSKDRPMVISVKNSKKGMTLVLAIIGHYRQSLNKK